MKKLSILVVMAAGLLLGSAAEAKGLKIGVVNMQRAVSETQEGKDAEAKLLKMKKKLEAELNRKLKEFYKEQEELQKAMAILKEDEKRKRLAESRTKFQALQKRYMGAERSLMTEKTQVMMRLSQKLGKVIQGIAKKENYDYVFNNAAVLWAPRHTDLTNQVIRIYNGGK